MSILSNLFSKAVESGVDILLSDNQPNYQEFNRINQQNFLQSQEMINPFSLGTFVDEKNPIRHRKEIYSKWEQMIRFAPIGEAMAIHVSASLGGDPATGEQVFITPAQRLKRSDLSKEEKKYIEMLEKRIPALQKLINKHIYKICYDAVSFGDAYVRVYGEEGVGVTQILCNEYTYPPLIQAYEHIDNTVAYHVLDLDNWTNQITKLSTIEMLRMKIPRMLDIKQKNYINQLQMVKVLKNNPDEAPIFPARVGGSFCSGVEKIFDDILLLVASMTSQEITDAVNQVFLTVDMSGMPPAQRQAWKDGFNTTLDAHRQFYTSALKGGVATYGTNFHVLPTFSDKQIVNALGDLKGQRANPTNIDKLMFLIRLLMGGLGLDPSMVGWADMLAGGLGDGASFHTSAQIMRRSMMVRQACKEMLNNLVVLDWAYAYGEMFQNEADYVWDIQFYSDQSASMTEMISNNQARMGALATQMAVLQQMKELGLSEEVSADLLERQGGFDYEQAQAIAKDLKASAEQAQEVPNQDDDEAVDGDMENDDE